jgi:predicted Fe-Mo cluster-binding NifX family protein
MKKLFTLFVVMFAAAAFMANAAPKNEVKIAVAATGKTVAATVGDKIAKSSDFLICDGSGKLIEALDNPYKDSESAGPSTVNFLSQKGVKVVIAESFGPRITGLMKSKGMDYFEFHGTAEDAVKAFLKQK